MASGVLDQQALLRAPVGRSSRGCGPPRSSCSRCRGVRRKWISATARASGRRRAARRGDGVVAAEHDRASLEASSSWTPSSTCWRATSMSNGLQGTSPASTAWSTAYGETSWAGLYAGRRCRDACRIALGPEARARAERDAAVERRAEQRDVEAPDLVDPGRRRSRRAGVPGPPACRRRVRGGCLHGVSSDLRLGKTRGVRWSERTCSAISRPVASQSPDSPAMVSISESSARRRPRRPLRNGWMVSVKHEPCRWASVSSPVHSGVPSRGSSMTPGPN
jgi:hypothetical protein